MSTQTLATETFINVYIVDDPTTGHIGARYRLEGGQRSLAQLVQEYVGDDCFVIVNGRVLEDGEVEVSSTRNGDQVVLVPKVGIGAAIVGMYAGGALSGTLVGSAIAGAINLVVGVGISFAINSLTPKPEQPKVFPQGTFSGGWTPQTHQAQGLPKPRGYGEFRLYGNVISAAIDSDSDNNETVSLLIGWGRGPYQGPVPGTLMLNGQPADNYENITTDTRNGTLNQTAIAVQNSGTVEYYPDRLLVKDTGVTYTTLDDDFSALDIVIAYPKGQHSRTSWAGAPMSWDLKIEIAVADSGSWSTLCDYDGAAGTSKTGESFRRVVETYKNTETYTGGAPVTITRGNRYDIRITLGDGTRSWTVSGGRGSTSTIEVTNDVEEEDVFGNRTFEARLHIVREYAMTPAEGLPTHPGTALTSIDALRTGQLEAGIKASQVWQQRIVNTYNGSSWTLQYSNNPAWVIWDLITLPVISGDGDGTAYAIEEYEGLDPSKLTPYLTEFYALAQRCDQMVDDGDGGTEKYATINGVFDVITDVNAAIKQVCRAAGCIHAPAGTGYRPVIDQAGTPVQMFNTANISNFKRTYYPKNQLASTIEGNYWPSTGDYQKTPLPRTNASAGGANIKKTMDLDLVTITGQACRILDKELLKNELIRSKVEFRANVDCIDLQVGENFTLQHDAVKADDCEHARIKSVTDADTIVLDRTFADTAGMTAITIRTAAAAGNDDLSTYTIDSMVVNATDTTVNLTTTLSPTPRQYDLVTIGSPQEYRCKKIKHHDDQKRIIEGEEYHASIHTIGSPVIPISGRDLSGANKFRFGSTPDETNANGGTTPDTLDRPTTRNCVWSGNETDTVSWGKADSNFEIQVLYRGYWYTVTTGSTTEKFVYWDYTQPYEFKGTSMVTAIDPALGQFQMCINREGIPVPTYGTTNVPAETMDGTLVDVPIHSTESGQRRLEMDALGLRLVSTSAAGKYGSFKYDDGTKWSSGVLAWIYDATTGQTLRINLEQTIGDLGMVDRASNPTGAAVIGDLCVVNGVLKVCTTAGTPGTWTTVGGQT